MTEIWNLIFLDPIMNVMIVLANIFGSFGLSIIAITIIVRLIMIPLTFRQLKSTKRMQDMQPRIAELQKKYAKDKQKLSEETMKLYKEVGMNPIGCIWPWLIQLPVWIALFQSIRQALAASPEDLLNLSQHLYSWSIVNRTIPLPSNFLWFSLAIPDQLYILPVLVGVTMWLQQKMTATPSVDPSQKRTNMMMQIMFPILFAFITIQFPSGLGLYFVVSAVVGIIIQYFVTGWGGLTWFNKKTTAIPALAQPRQKKSGTTVVEGKVDKKKKKITNEMEKLPEPKDDNNDDDNKTEDS
ncbi:MAG: YidC/Oxa1 family membrane protein insertase [Chloroflexi bacterium]|nr:YidC/Oxa1 family membrane protein insertase [Chloroflexota bacterium]